MLKLKLTIFLFALVFFSFGQQKKKATPEPVTNGPAEQTYHRAIRYGDYDVAKQALYALLAAHPERIDLLDSLVTLYFSLDAYPQCILSGNEYLLKDTVNLRVMEMVALSNSALKRNKEAVDLYEKMYLKTGRIYYAYQLAVHQYFMKRIGEATQMADIILNDPGSAKETLEVTTEETRQQVPLKAAAYNLKGIICSELNMTEQAIENYENALKTFPGFDLAKKNLDHLKSAGEKK